MAGLGPNAGLSGRYLSSGCPKSGLQFLYCAFPAYCGFLHYLSSICAENIPNLAYPYAYFRSPFKTYSDSLIVTLQRHCKH